MDKPITLATLETATEQEVFDQGAAHLLIQNAKSESDDDDRDCRYRDGNGRMCAAGCFLTDDEAAEIGEDIAWESLVERGAVPPFHAALIQDLQNVHDYYETREWEDRLRKLANDKGLLTDAIDQALQERNHV